MSKKSVYRPSFQPDKRAAYRCVSEAIGSLGLLLDRFHCLSAGQVRAELCRLHRSLIDVRRLLPRPKRLADNDVRKVIFGAQSNHKTSAAASPNAQILIGTGQTRKPGSHRST